MVSNKRDLNLKVERQRNIKQFDQIILLSVVIIISVITINKKKRNIVIMINQEISAVHCRKQFLINKK